LRPDMTSPPRDDASNLNRFRSQVKAFAKIIFERI